MENKLLHTIKFDNPIVANMEVGDEWMRICGVLFETHHERDCCENVYGDFAIAKHYIDQINELGKIKKIEIKSVPEAGFIVFVYNDKDEDGWHSMRDGVFIPCYNEQNGYYSDELDLIITLNDKKIAIGVDKFDKID